MANYRSEIFEAALANKVAYVVFEEVSRIGRYLTETSKLIDELHQKQIGVIVTSQNIVTMTNGVPDISANLLINILQSLATHEKDLLKERVKSGIEARREKGLHFGRPKGSTVEASKRLKKYKAVVSMLKDPEGHSLRTIAKGCNTSLSQVQRIKKLLQEVEQSPTSKRNLDRLNAFTEKKNKELELLRLNQNG